MDKMLAKIKATPNVTIFSIGTGALLNEMGRGGGMREMNYLQAQNQLRTFAEMTGGLSFSPLFPGELPDDFASINNSIRNQYLITYPPTNAIKHANRKEVRCPSCKKLLGKVWGREFSLETVCPRCNIKVLFEVNPPALARSEERRVGKECR